MSQLFYLVGAGEFSNLITQGRSTFLRFQNEEGHTFDLPVGPDQLTTVLTCTMGGAPPPMDQAPPEDQAPPSEEQQAQHRAQEAEGSLRGFEPPERSLREGAHAGREDLEPDDSIGDQEFDEDGDPIEPPLVLHRAESTSISAFGNPGDGSDEPL